VQLDAQDFIRLVESNRSLAIWDTESVGFNADYGTLLCGSIKTVHGGIETYQVVQLGNDKRVAREFKERLESFDAWVTYFGKGHDVPFLNTRLLRHGLDPVERRPHIDLFYSLKYALKLSSKSQAQLLSFLGTPEQKLHLGPDSWAELGVDFNKRMKAIVERCESDVMGLEAGFHRTKHVIRDIKR
jgi:uncharacterized protein YprB with RNaseH-like and TPR domain